MTRRTGPGIGRKFSRDEGFWYIFNTMKEKSPVRANIIDSINYVEQKLVFRTIEAGTGIKIEILDADGLPPENTPYTKLRLSGTMQEGVNIRVGGTPIGTVPATTLDFDGPVSAAQTSPGTVKITVEAGAADFDVLASGAVVNTGPIQNLNFFGDGVVVTESGPGEMDIEISNLGTVLIQEDGVPLPGTFTTLNFVGVSGAITDLGGGVVQLNLTPDGGFNIISPFNAVFTGATVPSGSYTVSAFFGTDSPDPTEVIVMVNGLVLEYSLNPILSSFDVLGSDLLLNVDNMGFPLEQDDKITSYYWNIT